MNDIMMIISILTILTSGLMGALAFINYRYAKKYEERYKKRSDD